MNDKKLTERALAMATVLCATGIVVAVVSIWFVPWPLWGKTLASGGVLFAAGLIVGMATQP